MAVIGAIRNLSYPIRIPYHPEVRTLFDARDLKLVSVNRDPVWGYFEYQVRSTGAIHSFQKYLNESDRSEWYQKALQREQAIKSGQEVNWDE
jgi:hypothetical protein